MKRKILLVILAFLTLLIIVLIGLKFMYIEDKSPSSSDQDKNTTVDEVDFSNIRTVDMCKDKSNCPFLGDSLYSDLTFDFDSKEMQSWIKKVNKKTKKYYKETINSNLDDEVCADVRDKYNYRVFTTSYYNNYINYNYVSLAVKRVSSDVCNVNSKAIPTEVFIYSKKKKKQITQDELKEELHLKEEIIRGAIEKSVKFFVSQVPADFDYSNYTLYYDSTGCLLAEYYLSSNDSYHSATVLY